MYLLDNVFYNLILQGDTPQALEYRYQSGSDVIRPVYQAFYTEISFHNLAHRMGTIIDLAKPNTR